MRLRNDKKRKNGCDENKITTTPPQPINYLYYMRLRNDKKRKNGSYRIKMYKIQSQPP